MSQCQCGKEGSWGSASEDTLELVSEKWDGRIDRATALRKHCGACRSANAAKEFFGDRHLKALGRGGPRSGLDALTE